MTCSAEEGRAADGGVGIPDSAQDNVCVGDAALDKPDADIPERGGILGVADQRAHVVATLDQLFAHVGAGLAATTGNEDDARHLRSLS